MRFRSVIFWFHLSAAVLAGVPILIFCFSGAVLASHDQVLDWAERDVRRPGAPAASTARLTFHEALATASRSQPAVAITGLTVSKDPGDAITLTTADRKNWCVNPYTGEMRQDTAPRLDAFYLAIRRLHAKPPLGEGFSASANVVFLFLTLSGLYLWWPRTWSWSAVRPTIWFVSGARGRARDWNWHNVVAIWLLPILFVLTATGVVLSSGPVNRLMFRLAGEPLPNPPAANQAARPAPKPVAPPADAPSLEDFMAQVEKNYQDWRQMSFSFQPAIAPAKSGERGLLNPQALYAAVAMPHPWPVFAVTNVTRDHATGELRAKDSYADLGPGWRTRRWVRLSHSGDAFGLAGQIIAGFASLGGCLLVYTGYAMALRRLFNRIRARAT